MTRASRNTYLLPALLVAVVFLLYGRTLTFDFVNYDDYDLIVRNTDFLKDPGNIVTSFSTHAFSSHRDEGVYYRPVLLLSYFADYALWGVDPLGFHLTNVLLHAGATLLFFLLVVEILRQAGPKDQNGRGQPVTEARGGNDRLTAFLAALLFGVHPVQTESVAWISGRNDVLLGLLLLGSFWCYVSQYRESPRRLLMFPLSAVLFAAAIFTKESAIFLLPVFPLYELGVRRESLVTLFSGAKHLRVSVFLAVVVAYLGLRYNIFGAFIGAEKLYGRIPFYNRILMAPGLGLTNLLFLAWPANLSIVHPLENVGWFDWPAILVAIGTAAGLFTVVVRYFRRDPILSLSVAWLLTSLVPLLNVFPLAVPILEHRLYTATAGFSLAVTLVATRLGGGLAGRRAGRLAGGAAGQPGGERRRGGVVVPVLAGLTLTLALLTWMRLPVWKDSEALWLDALAKEPGSPRPYFNLAGYYFEQQKYDRTLTLLETYVKLKPEDFIGWSKLRQTYFLAGRPMDAAAVCRTLIDQNPRNISRYVEAGVLFERLGLRDSVVALYEEGLRVDPAAHQLHRRLGAWYQSAGVTGKALWHLRAADSLESIVRKSQPR